MTSKLLRYAALLCAGTFTLLILAGCAPQEGNAVNTAPAALANTQTLSDIEEAEFDAKDMLADGPATTATNAAQLVTTLKQAATDARATNAAIVVVQKQANAQAATLVKITREETYYKKIADSKVEYIVIALFVGALLFYGGEWLKDASPYTMLLPNAIAGLLTVMAGAAILAAVVTLWDTLGWVIHLL